jgi:hypothetical protein
MLQRVWTYSVCPYGTCMYVHKYLHGILTVHPRMYVDRMHCFLYVCT